MKMSFFKRQPLKLFFGVAMAVSTVFISCDKNDDVEDRTYTTTGNADGSKMNPSNNSTATGTLTGTYDAKVNVWSYTINWTNLSATAGLVQVFGPAAVGANGSLLHRVLPAAPVAV
jgi:hypothetical protein